MRDFWRWLTTSRYTRRLEDENAELKERVRAYEHLLLPRLQISNTTSTVVQSPDSEHSTPIDAKISPITKFKRVNWTEARNKLETLTSKDLQTEQRMQKAVNAHANI